MPRLIERKAQLVVSPGSRSRGTFLKVVSESRGAESIDSSAELDSPFVADTAYFVHRQRNLFLAFVSYFFTLFLALFYFASEAGWSYREVWRRAPT